MDQQFVSLSMERVLQIWIRSLLILVLSISLLLVKSLIQVLP